jgi:hypothetical protein
MVVLLMFLFIFYRFWQFGFGGLWMKIDQKVFKKEYTNMDLMFNYFIASYFCDFHLRVHVIEFY